MRCGLSLKKKKKSLPHLLSVLSKKKEEKQKKTNKIKERNNSTFQAKKKNKKLRTVFQSTEATPTSLPYCLPYLTGEEEKKQNKINTHVHCQI
jgi:hypothetical protein